MSVGPAVRTKILVEGSPASCRVAIVEDGHLVEYHPAEEDGVSTSVGDAYLGRVSKLAPGVEAAFVDIGLENDAFLPAAEWPEDGLTSGQSVVVQIQKDPVGGKGARVTTRLALAGRYLVFLPRGLRVRMSKRIPEGEERDRLEELGATLLEEGDGMIIRTNAQGVEGHELGADVERLRLTYKQIQAKARVSTPPSRLFREPGPAARIVRDHLTENVEAVLVGSAELLTEVRSAAETIPAELVGRIRVEKSPFKAASVERAVERALQPKVYMKSGGHVVIEPTEALTTVDVNSGGSKGGADLEATALATNLDACAITARQIRLRDLGGILVIDFIDMAEDSHRDQVRARLEEALARDKGNPKIHGWTDLGLMILSRRRRRMPLFRMLTRPCGSCGSTGRVDAPTRVVEKAGRACRAYLTKNIGKSLVLRVTPDLVPVARDHLEDVYERVTVKGDRHLPAHRFQVDPDESHA